MKGMMASVSLVFVLIELCSKEYITEINVATFSKQSF